MTLAAAIAGLFVALGAPAPAGDEVGDDAVVATIDGRAIPADRFARFVLVEREHSSAGAEALQQLVQERLVEREARRRGIRVTEQDVDLRARQIEEGLRAQSQGRQGLDDHLAGLKISRDAFRVLLHKSIACERMMAADFGLPAGALVPPEKQSLWFRDLESRASVTKEGLPAGVAATVEGQAIARTAWALKIFEGLPPAEGDKLFEDFIAVDLLLTEGAKEGIEVGPEQIRREIEERSRLVREMLTGEGLPSEGVDYLSTLKARGEDPAALLEGERFRAEIVLKELARRRFGEDGFRAFYEERRAVFDQAFGRRVRVATLFLKAAQQKSAKVARTWTEASEELEALKVRVLAESAGRTVAETFASLAKLRSEHESAARGGDLGLLSQAQLEKRGLPPSLLDVPPGTLEGPIVTADGVHLFFVVEARAASPFEEIVGEVEKSARREVVKRLRDACKVERKI
jgi:parvulin-like peptidyl-prolyl isomerase